ncbi:MAG: fasciclin domain-containing protein [Dysgonamonadaceae bacterium]|nr:fasciclin domain-containing protein [Dysgonamonadaceae bacterium]
METALLQKRLLNACRMICMLLGLVWMTSCEKMMEGETYRVYDDKMLDELMEEYQLTTFLSIVEKAGFTGTIHAYGAYTLFVPTNEAIDAYCQRIGKSNADALTKEEAEDIVKYHLIRTTREQNGEETLGSDSLTTSDFVDGRLAFPNFAKKYLTSKNEDGKTYRINRQANIIEGGKDIKGANGHLQIIDNVLTPPENNIAKTIRQLPDADYSLMKEIFERSGMAESLSVEEEDNWFTFFIQDNKAFEDAGIHSIADLLEELKESTPAIQDEDTLLYNYIGYHSVHSLMYITDLLSISSLQTLIPKQVLTFKRNLDVILLNELIQGQMYEPGIPLDRTSDYSDLSCANGVIHKIDGNIQIKNRTAYRIYWDIAEQPEIIALKDFRKQGTNVNFSPGDLSEITWGGKAPGDINYYCGGISTVLDEKFQYAYGDYLRFNLYSLTTSWMEMITPVLVEGKYKVWVCYRRELELNLKTVFKQEGYDDQVLPYVINLSEYMPNPTTNGESVIEIEGWKQYNAKKYNSVVCSRLLGIIDVQTTGRHTLRFEPTTGGRGQQAGSWDMIHFIPIEEDQLWPKVDLKGNWIGQEVPDCQIYPESQCETEGEE